MELLFGLIIEGSYSLLASGRGLLLAFEQPEKADDSFFQCGTFIPKVTAQLHQ